MGGKVGASLKDYASESEGIEEGRGDVQDVDLYAKIRRAVMLESQSERGAAKQFGISRKTVSKMVWHAVPPGYQRNEAPVSPKLGPFIGAIHQIL